MDLIRFTNKYGELQFLDLDEICKARVVADGLEYTCKGDPNDRELLGDPVKEKVIAALVLKSRLLPNVYKKPL